MMERLFDMASVVNPTELLLAICVGLLLLVLYTLTLLLNSVRKILRNLEPGRAFAVRTDIDSR